MIKAFDLEAQRRDDQTAQEAADYSRAVWQAHQLKERTEYAIRLHCGQWLGDRSQWQDTPASARRFFTMTAANIYAVFEIGLSPDAYTVEAI